MKLMGKIVSGMGKGTFFMSQDFYKTQFQDKVHFTPFEGTLNLKIDSDSIDSMKTIPKNKFGLIHGEGKFGDVKYIRATINNEICGALVFPAKSEHNEDVLEFITDKNLRKQFQFMDGDDVTIIIG
jgi:riboflavin kinase, archaea type